MKNIKTRIFILALAAAAAAAVVAGCNGFFMARVTFTDHFASAAWLPAILYAQEVGSPLGLGFCLALQWLAGFPPFFMVSLVAAAVWAACQGRQGVMIFGQGCLWALGLCAIQVVPFLEMLVNSARGVFLYPAAAVKYSVPARQLLKELFMPLWSFYSPTLAGDPAIVTFYAGVLVLGLALWGIGRGRRREAGFALATAGACLLSLGGGLPGYRIIPLFHVFRFPANWLLLAASGLSLLCAAGIAVLTTARARWLAAAAVTLELILFAQPTRVAWARPGLLTDAPVLARTLSGGAGPMRIYHTGRLFSLWKQGSLRTEEDYLLMRDFLAPSFGTAFGIQEVSSYQTLAPRLSVMYAQRLAAQRLPSSLLDRAGVAMVVDLAPGAGRIERDTLRVILNPGARPRVFPEDATCAQVKLLGYHPGLVTASVAAVRPTKVVLAETDYPGWRAWVDGRPVASARYDDIFPAVAVLEGKHEVRFRFVSLTFWWGALISAVTFIGWLLSVRNSARVRPVL